MASVVISGDTSGSVTLSAPAVAGSTTQTLVAATGTLAPLVRGTVPPTSGTSIDFTNIPSWVKRITVVFAGLNSSSASSKIVQIGTGGVATASGYVGSGTTVNSGAATTSFTTGFGIRADGATFNLSGIMTICNVSGNTWVASQTLSHSGLESGHGGGIVTLSGVLDFVRITTVSGAGVFGSGSANIMYE